MKKTEQNKNSSVPFLHRSLSFLFAIFLLSTCLFVSPVFAIKENDVDFSAISTVSSSPTLLGYNGSTPEYVYQDSGSKPVYLVAYPRGSYNQTTVRAFSEATFTCQYVIGQTLISRSASYNGTYYFYDTELTSREYSGLNAPLYSTSAEALSSASDFLVASSVTGTAQLLSPSFLTVSTSTYLKSSMSDVSAYAYYFDGTSYHLVVGSINYNNFVSLFTDTSNSPVNLLSRKTISDTILYYNSNVVSVSESDTSFLGYFLDVDSALSAIFSVCDTSEASGTPGSSTLQDLQYTLKPGNVIFIDISGTNATYAELVCNLSGTSWYTLSDFNSTMNYMFGYLNDLPSSFTYPIFGTSLISWAANSKPTVTSTYSSFKSSLSTNSQAKYLCIVNPVYENMYISSATLLDPNAYSTNNNIEINCKANNFYVYSLKVDISYSDGNSVYDTTSTGTQYSGTYDPSTDSWVTVNTSTGEVDDPSFGGEVNPILPQTSISSWLSNIASEISSFMDRSMGAISTLVGAGGAFFGVLMSLYSWLPGPVYSVLSSALVLLITIGLIKVFL